MKDRELLNDEIHADDMTWREQEVLLLLEQRLTNREIAGRLHLAESTVKDYVGKILSKLYVKNRREAVERAKVLGLLEVDRETGGDRPTGNLPDGRTPFIGRQEELDQIGRHLRETRLLTLLGPGGIGKTRLAIMAAAGAAGDFKDGCFFVSLAPLRFVGHIVQTIAEAVKFPLATHEDPQHQLLRFLKKRQLLLVMDNFEHLLGGVDIVSKILQSAPEVKILATSREKLNLQTETTIHVRGMNIPCDVAPEDPLNYDAISLFIQSARKVRSGFEPSLDGLGQIIQICHMVEGLPLAIELAAGWLHLLNVEEVVRELEKGLDILTTEARDAPARHRSIRSVFDHSWSLMEPEERQTFELLSVFRGGFTREAAETVTGASLQRLSGLVNQSFLIHDAHTGRLEVHELLRQYAQEQLGETTEAWFNAQEAHAAYYAAFMHQRWQLLKGKRQQEALAEVEADIENVRAAWRHYLDQKNASQMWKFIHGLWYVYWIRWWNHAGMELFGEAARVLQGEGRREIVALRGLVEAFHSYFIAWLGLSDQGYELAKQSVKTLQHLKYQEALIFAYDSLVVNAYFLNRFTEEIEAIDQMVRIASELDDPWLLAFTLYAASLGALIKKEYDQAKHLAESNLILHEELGDRIGSTMPLIVLGHVALASGEFEDARVFYLRCLKISQEVGFHYSIQTSSKYLGKVALSLGKLEEAETFLLKSLAISKEIGFVRDMINLLYEFARLQLARGQTESAVNLLAMVVQHPASHSARMLEGRIRDSARGLLARLEAILSPEAYATAWEQGRGMDLDEIIAALVFSKVSPPDNKFDSMI